MPENPYEWTGPVPFQEMSAEDMERLRAEKDQLLSDLKNALDADVAEHPEEYAAAEREREHDPETGEPLRDEYSDGPTKALQKWADVAMWAAPKHDDPQTPKVTVSMVTPDPLGVMAMVNGQYTGKVYNHPSEVTNAERVEAWEAATVSRLSETPLEWIQLSISFENVSRAFTHQLVRTRLATYAQESMRFAVKEDIGDAVKLPPSLAGTVPQEEFEEALYAAGLSVQVNTPAEQRWRNRWDTALKAIEKAYLENVNDGMPAEDARGLLPTNILTRIHMRCDMKTLLNLAGMRLCTQAQFEWRGVFAKLVEALRAYGREQSVDQWQYERMSERFRPVCFAAGRCTMKAKSDRHCAIRAQVDAFERAGVPSSHWETWPGHGSDGRAPIRPAQWLADPTAARVAP